MSKKQVFLCDIDGTIASAEGIRNIYDESLVSKDRPLPTVTLIKALAHLSFTIIFVSGRTDKCKEDTLNWIKNWTGITKPEIYMRKSGDRRPDVEIKKEIYEKEILPKYEVYAVFDDRLSVCRMWYELGLFVFNCNQGLKEF